MDAEGPRQKEDLMPMTKRGRMPKRVGVFFILFGFLCNPWVIGVLFSGDGSIDWVGYRVVIWVFELGLIGTGLYLALRKPPKLVEDAKNLALLSVSLLFSAFLVEIVLRIFVPGPQFHPSLAFYPHRKVTFTTNLPGVSDTVTVTTNKWGMRGDPIPSDWTERITIIAIGGSTTKCSFLPDDKTWPTQLQKLLRQVKPDIMVQNAGLTGHSTRGHTLLMEQMVTKVKPDMIVLLVGLNDLGVSLSEEEVNHYLSSPGLHYSIFAQSRVIQLLYSWYRILVDKIPVEEKPGELERELFELKPLTRRTSLPEDVKTILPSLQLFQNNVETIIDSARENNIDILLLTQPLLFGDSDYWDQIQGESYWFQDQAYSISAATYWNLLSIFNETLLETCALKAVPCYDLAAVVPHRQEYFYDAMHFTESGAELVARKTFQFMVEGDHLPSDRH